MDYKVALLVFGILLFIVGLVGKVKAKELEVGTSSRIVRLVMSLLGIVLIVLSFNPEIVKTIVTTSQEQTGEVIQGDQQTFKKEDEQESLVKEERPEKQLRGVYTIQQKSNGRYVDAHEYKGKDYAIVTRSAQNNDTQRWILTPLGNNTYTIQQKSNGRYVDAHEYKGKDYAVVTRSAQNNDTQRWILTPLSNNTYTIQQKSSGRYLDAHEYKEKDYAIVTRTSQNNDTQRWLIKAM
jgi:hypothetical protein